MDGLEILPHQPGAHVDSQNSNPPWSLGESYEVNIVLREALHMLRSNAEFIFRGLEFPPTEVAVGNFAFYIHIKGY